jgi:5-methylcytosine-specific restriction endonuclease McrA
VRRRRASTRKRCAMPRLAKRKRATEAQRTFLSTRQAGRCAICGFPLSVQMHVDHIIPRAKGGRNGINNLQLVCARCNIKKGRALH